MDIYIECDEEIKDGDPLHNFGHVSKMVVEQKIVCTHLSGSVVINGRYSRKTLIKPILKKTPHIFIQLVANFCLTPAVLK